jgi:hypothetical protein
MSERDTDISASTDSSASTAEFRAFASRAGGEDERPWAMRAPGRRIGLLAAAVIGVAVVLAVIAVIVLRA